MNSKKNRIIFLDILRAIAVLMMVQGHTIDSLLADEYRTFDSDIYSVWHTLRGFTAPIFMFTAGVVFTYLLNLNKLSFRENPRVKKGVKRFFLLLGLGYLLRYPTYKIIDFSNVSEAQWKIFFTVDALHLIAFGLLFILIFTYISERFKLNNITTFSAGTLFFFLMVFISKEIAWGEFLPQFAAGYFTREYGSIFPLFPYAGYVLAGGIMGIILAGNREIYKDSQFMFKLLLVGASLTAFSYLFFGLINVYEPETNYWTSKISLVFFRLGIVLILSSLIGFASLKLKNIPNIIKLIGRHTLLIYVVHLIIIYGSAWSPGLARYFKHSFTIYQAITAATVMILLMIGFVWIVNKIIFERKEKKNKLAAANFYLIKPK
jgi:uncharacterized membrane protein